MEHPAAISPLLALHYSRGVQPGSSMLRQLMIRASLPLPFCAGRRLEAASITQQTGPHSGPPTQEEEFEPQETPVLCCLQEHW